MPAVTHLVSAEITRCELTYLDRQSIDYKLAVRQHEAYCAQLRNCGLEVTILDENLAFPDSCFVEDTAIVLAEVAVIANPGVASRQGEVAAMERALRQYRPIRRIQSPATIEGGDVLQAGKTLFVGLSSRTNQKGAQALADIAEPYGYKVVPVAVSGSLHLKTACSLIAPDTLLVNPAWLDGRAFTGWRLINVHETEPWAANTLLLKDKLLMLAGFPHTQERVTESINAAVMPINISEFQKAEAGLTCLSIVF